MTTHGVSLDISKAQDYDLKPYIAMQRAANYLSGAMIFLKANVLLDHPLTPDDIKPRLLGHWGTCPGINLTYAHCTRLIKQHRLNMLFVTGPGHGAPANLANLFLERAITKYYPKYSYDRQGLERFIRGFTWPSGFPSHTNSEMPGQIHEGGELGYALAVSFGAALDNPDLIVTCMVGDGEAETGPTATAWHTYKYLDPATSGAVLPVLHLNGFKIANRTIFGCMSDDELVTLFSGYGYQVRIVTDNNDTIQQDMAVSMEWAVQEIQSIQKAARSNKPIYKPLWPMIILRSPKGWTGPKTAHGKQIEGTLSAHQVPLPHVKKDKEELKVLEDWLKHYRPDELFDKRGRPVKEIQACYPEDEELRMGMRIETQEGSYRPLDTPDWKQFCIAKDEDTSSTDASASYLAEVIKRNQKTFRIFSPDELSSNKLSKVLDVTSRTMEWDPDLFTKGGRVLEVLSEHTCQGLLQGYTLTGRTGLFPSYEAFLGIVTTMLIQYAKFLKLGQETLWKRPLASINYIESSTLWRQEHNGFSHQNPAFLNNLMNLKSDMIRIYLPPDANCMLSTLDHCLRSQNYINLIVSAKNPTPVWITSADKAAEHCRAGLSVWTEFSTDGGRDPDVIIAGCGVETTFEAVAAAALLRQDCPDLRVRLVNVTDLMTLKHTHRLSQDEFNAIFTTDKPIIFNFHGYPSAIKSLAYDRVSGHRMSVHGYNEEGTTTTQFRMLTANGCSRYDLAIDALHSVIPDHPTVSVKARTLISNYQHAIHQHEKYIEKNGTDPSELSQKPAF